MKIIFLSNYFTHHQYELSEELNRLTLKKYNFVEHEEMDAERKSLGWQNQSLPSYVMRDSIETNNKEFICSDVLIVGSFPEANLDKYRKNTKVLFRYSERLFKNKDSIIKYPVRFIRWHKANPKSENIYLLCASAYTSLDYSRYHLFAKKSYKWGYFPETRHYDEIYSVLKKKNKNHIFWCGRFLDWKHPEVALWVASELKRREYSFTMELVGSGPLEENLKKEVREKKLEKYVKILPSLSPDEIRKKMEQAGIFLFTSDRREGWGAVVNEAMNSGCAVVASHIAGSVPYLIENSKNGYVYKFGDNNQLLGKVANLLENPDTQEQVGQNAYETIINEWNAEIAAKRLTEISNRILNGEEYPILYKTGPCSPSEVIKENWFVE